MRRLLRTRLAVAAAAVSLALVAALTVALSIERGAPPGDPPTGRAALASLVEYQTSPNSGIWALERAEDEAQRALDREPEDVEALDALATAAASRHDFPRALALADQSLAIAPLRLAPLGVKGDTLIELGRYAAAFAVVDTSIESRPDIASYARASYASELRGDADGAIALMRLAAESGLPGSPSRAGAQLQLALLLLREGRVGAAERVFQTIGGESPGNPEATIGAARVAVARGQLRRAERLYRDGIVALPDADHWAELADVQDALGRTAERDESVANARAGLRRGAEVEDNALEIAVLDADWSRPDADDVTFAREARERRPSIVGDAALGWVLTRAGLCAEAHEVATRSLRLGTRDPLLFFRAGAAAECAGEPAAARERFGRALDLNQRFSARWAPVAREALGRL